MCLFSAVCFAETIRPNILAETDSVVVIAAALADAEETGSGTDTGSAQNVADAVQTGAMKKDSDTQADIENDTASSIATNNSQDIGFAKTAAAFPAMAVAGGSVVQAVRLWTAPNYTRLVFDLNQSIKYKVFRLHKPERIVIDMQNTRLKAHFNKLAIPDSVIKAIRHETSKAKMLRVVMDVKEKVQPRSFLLKPTKGKSFRLVIDLMRPQKDKAEAMTVEKSVHKAIVIAMDAGYGGEGSGAVGSRKLNFSQIDSDYDIGHFEEALWALQDLQKLYPNNGDVLYRIGLVQEGMLDFDAAREAYEQAVKNMADPSLAYSRLGNLLYSMNHYTQAIVAFEHVIRLKPDSAHSSYMLGMSHMNTGEFSASVQAFKRAGEIDASFKQRSIYGQGINYIRMGQNAKAQALLKESIALDPESDVAALAKKSLGDAINLEKTSYFSIFGLYGFQFDSNVVLNPSSSVNIPIISGTSDFAHTFLAALNYAPPPDGRMGYKVSARFYQNIHAQLRTFDVTGIGFTLTPYVSINDKNILFLDASYDYYLFDDKRYMDTIIVKPTLIYTYSNQLQLMGSVLGSRENYYQPVLLQTSNQGGWTFKEELKIYGFSEDQKSTVQLGGHFTTGRTRGADWSYNAYGGSAGVDVAVPYVEKLTAGIHGSIDRHKYQNLAVGYSQKRRDTVYNGSVSLSYHFTYADVSVTGSYTHELSTIEVYNYVRMMTAVNISGSF